jgi:hypothetical protein
VEYRRLKPEDVADVAEFAAVGMQAHRYPLRVSMAKVNATVQHFERSATDFHLVAFDGGKVAGAIAAAVAELPFFERWEAHVVMCRAVVPGVGRRLIAALRAWADQDFRIKRVQFPQEYHADPRALKLLARYGFAQTVTTAVYYKG